jgi:ribosomal protein S4E
MNGREATFILNDKEGGILVDHKVRRDKGFPVGIMDVVQIPKTKENFRVLYDVKGRFVVKPIEDNEANVFPFVNSVQAAQGQEQGCRPQHDPLRRDPRCQDN